MNGSSNKNNNLFDIISVLNGMQCRSCNGVCVSAFHMYNESGHSNQEKEEKTNNAPKMYASEWTETGETEHAVCNLKRKNETHMHPFLNDEQMPDNWVCACFVMMALRVCILALYSTWILSCVFIVAIFRAFKYIIEEDNDGTYAVYILSTHSEYAMHTTQKTVLTRNIARTHTW